MAFAGSLGGARSAGIGHRPAEGRYYRVSDIVETVGTGVRVVGLSFCQFVSPFAGAISAMVTL